jgi:hypothetical protein
VILDAAATGVKGQIITIECLSQRLSFDGVQPAILQTEDPLCSIDLPKGGTGFFRFRLHLKPVFQV